MVRRWYLWFLPFVLMSFVTQNKRYMFSLFGHDFWYWTSKATKSHILKKHHKRWRSTQLASQLHGHSKSIHKTITLLETIAKTQFNRIDLWLEQEINIINQFNMYCILLWFKTMHNLLVSDEWTHLYGNSLHNLSQAKDVSFFTEMFNDEIVNGNFSISEGFTLN